MAEPPAFSARSMVHPKAMSPPTHAVIAVRNTEWDENSPKNVKSKAMTAIAATPAPEDTPMMYGSTSGFLMMAW